MSPRLRSMLAAVRLARGGPAADPPNKPADHSRSAYHDRRRALYATASRILQALLQSEWTEFAGVKLSSSYAYVKLSADLAADLLEACEKRLGPRP